MRRLGGGAPGLEAAVEAEAEKPKKAKTKKATAKKPRVTKAKTAKAKAAKAKATKPKATKAKKAKATKAGEQLTSRTYPPIVIDAPARAGPATNVPSHAAQYFRKVAAASIEPWPRRSPALPIHRTSSMNRLSSIAFAKPSPPRTRSATSRCRRVSAPVRGARRAVAHWYRSSAGTGKGHGRCPG